MARRRPANNVYAFRAAPPRRRRLFGFPWILLMCFGAAFWVVQSGVMPSVWQQVLDATSPTRVSSPGEAVAGRQFFECASSRTLTCVVDGDTIRLEGTSIRIADIDTPEVFSSQCPEELARGNAATRRMAELLSAGPFDMVLYDNRDEDMYGRKLRVLLRDGQSLGQMLVAEGLARTWDGARHPWC